MQAVFSLLGAVTLLLVSAVAVLALVIVVLHEARYIIRLSLGLCADAVRTQRVASKPPPQLRQPQLP
jgi:hypothetical protein